MATKQTVVLVEDEAQQRDILTMLLETEGYEVVAVDSAEKALELLQDLTVHLVITDVKLPDMDGFTFFERVREVNAQPPIPFLFITGYNNPATIERVKSLGAAGYITKPYDLEKLVDIVRKFLPA
jgi:CheY-like chemotaxis protein